LAKSKINESHTLNIEGILDTDNTDGIKVEVEELGVKDLKTLIQRFNGCSVHITVKLNTDINN
jgi:hypothetical protein